MLEEHPSSASAGWARRASKEDTRTLAELAESVMAAAAAAAEPAGETAGETAAGVHEAAETPVPESAEPSETRSRRWPGIAAIVAALIVGSGGIFWFGLSTSSGGKLDSDRAVVALVPGGGGDAGEPPSEAIADVTPAAGSSQMIAAGPTPTPSPDPTVAPTPAATNAPTAEPTVAAAPTAAPTAPADRAPSSSAVHIGDLDGAAKGPKVEVRVYVHNSSHSPAAGAVVRVLWSGGYSGTSSCSADVNGACVFRTGNLSPGVTVTLAVTGVTYSGASYDPELNHDPDADSNGTSISVEAKA